jgi:predicted S18 family serine protease
MLVAAPRRRPAPVAAAATIVVGLLALLLAGCGRPAAGELVVPVLWAAGSGDASTGGVERARVLVGDGDGGYTVDLADSRAEGAGPAWLAASASAATVATLVSGVDPSSIRIRFTVTGRIDGPSGGAALAVGVLAAIRGQTLREGVTMTGTISPDAAVGRVSGVPAKVRAAADEGFDLVLVPVGNAGDRDPGTGLDVVALGASLGVEVRPVADLGEAVAAFTGGPITAGPDSAPPLTPAVDAVAASRRSRRSPTVRSPAPTARRPTGGCDSCVTAQRSRRSLRRTPEASTLSGCAWRPRPQPSWQRRKQHSHAPVTPRRDRSWLD